MPLSPIHGWTTPDGSEEPQVHLDLESLAAQIDADVPLRAAVAPAHKAGRIWINSVDGSVNFSDGSTWLTYDTVWQTYTPVWSTASGLQPALGNGTMQGFYFRKGKSMALQIHQAFGSTTNGGNNSFKWSLPLSVVPLGGSTNEWWGGGKVYASGGAWNLAVYARVLGGTNFIEGWGPLNSGNVNLLQLKNTDASGTGGTGVPNSAGFPFGTGSNIFLTIEFPIV